MKCTLCGFEFEEDQAQPACISCCLMKGCKLIRCPNCGFETPREPGWMRHLEEKKSILPLTDLKVNQKGKVASIHTKDHKKLQKLMAMHILPGREITLIQKFPSYVFQIGHSQFAVDKGLAETILVNLTVPLIYGRRI